jgi:hypothetical protein
VVSPDPLYSVPSMSSVMKTPENTEDHPDVLEPEDEADI